MCFYLNGRFVEDDDALGDEATALVNAAPYERRAERAGHRNGSYRRDLNTRFGQIEDLRVPRVQMTNGSTTPAFQIFDRWQRRTPDLEQAIGQMFVLGISTRKLRNLCDELWGAPPRKVPSAARVPLSGFAMLV